MNICSGFCPDLPGAHGVLFLQLQDGDGDPNTPRSKFKHANEKGISWKQQGYI